MEPATAPAKPKVPTYVLRNDPVVLRHNEIVQLLRDIFDQLRELNAKIPKRY